MKQMMRTYTTADGKTITTDKAKFFINREVEKTPMFGKMTLFVCGIQDLDKTIQHANNNDIKHIYLGTGTTFLPESDKDWDEWDKYISGLLDADFWVTLDFDLMTYGDGVLECAWVEYRRFIPMMSLKLGYWKQWNLNNHNATVKFDDVDFNKTNPGVWCVPLEECISREHFSDWDKYVGDTFIE